MEEYVKNIALFNLQKYALALAFAILKHKPENVLTKDFIDELKEQCNSIDLSIHNSENLPSNEKLHELSNNCNVSFTTEPINSETSQIFKKISEYSQIPCGNEISKSDVITELEAIQASEYVKTIIGLMNKRNSSEHVVTGSNISSQYLQSQDSGYRSSQNSDNYKMKKTDFRKLNENLLKITKFLNSVSCKTIDKVIVERISTIFGETLDQLYIRNIYLPFYDHVTDILDSLFKVFQNILSNETELIKNVLLKFCIFSKSHLIIQYCFQKLTNNLKTSVEKLFLKNSIDAVELNEPLEINNIFYTFQIFEIILKRINNLKPDQLFDNDVTDTNTEGDLAWQNKQEVLNKFLNEKEQLSTELTALFSTIVLECSETYPLVAFWAMECHNIFKNNKH